MERVRDCGSFELSKRSLHRSTWNTNVWSWVPHPIFQSYLLVVMVPSPSHSVIVKTSRLHYSNAAYSLCQTLNACWEWYASASPRAIASEYRVSRKNRTSAKLQDSILLFSPGNTPSSARNPCSISPTITHPAVILLFPTGFPSLARPFDG